MNAVRTLTQPALATREIRSGRRGWHSLGGLFAALLTLLIAGCASHAERIRTAREMFYAGDAQAAALQLEGQLEEDKKERDVVALDLVMARLFTGQPREAERTLRHVRDRFDHLEQQDLAEVAWSYVTDDNRRAYAGEDYEKVLIRVMLALSNLMVDGQDAEAYSLQVTAKQDQIVAGGAAPGEENPKAVYPRVAFGPYLRGVLRESTHRDYDDVERSFANVVSWQPSFTAGHADLLRAREGRHSPPGHGVAYVFAFVGRGPYKRAVDEVPTSQMLLLADRILSVTGEYTLPPTIAPIQVPQVVTFDNEVDRMQVIVNGQPAGVTETVTDVGQLAVEQYQAVYPQIVARAVARRAVKKATVYAAKDSMGSVSPWANLAMDVAGVAWEASEAADTRCWALLPDSIQVLRLELPVGRHELMLQPAWAGNPAGTGIVKAIDIEDGRNTYVLLCSPGRQIAGDVLVSTP